MYLNTSDKVKVKYKYILPYLWGIAGIGRHWSDLKSDAVRRESSSLSSPIIFGPLSQWLEKRTHNPCVLSSNLRWPNRRKYICLTL